MTLLLLLARAQIRYIIYFAREVLVLSPFNSKHSFLIWVDWYTDIKFLVDPSNSEGTSFSLNFIGEKSNDIFIFVFDMDINYSHNRAIDCLGTISS